MAEGSLQEVTTKRNLKMTDPCLDPITTCSVCAATYAHVSVQSKIQQSRILFTDLQHLQTYMQAFSPGPKFLSLRLL